MTTIVDFPSRPDAESRKRSSSSSGACRPRRSLNFSPVSHLCLYTPEEGESDEQQWYSSADKERFKLQAAREALLLGRALSSQSPALQAVPTEDIICMCIGLEDVLSASKRARTLRQKREHARIIVSMQDRCSVDELGRISRESSNASGERAAKLAAGYMKIENA